MNDIKDKSLRFAVNLLNLYRKWSKSQEYLMFEQLMRSGTAIGALCREAEQTESTKDLVHKMVVAQKKCNDTLYWLEVLGKSNYIKYPDYVWIQKEAVELMKLVTSTIETKKRGL